MREEGVWEVSGARQEKMDGEEVVFENLPIGWVNFNFINIFCPPYSNHIFKILRSPLVKATGKLYFWL